MNSTGTLLVITGPTASGKDAVITQLLIKFPDFKKVITTTTRKPRRGEKDEVDHFFVERAEFEKRERAGGFLETNEYSNNLYGTTRFQIERVLDGEGLIWRIDPSAAAKVDLIIEGGFDKNTARAILRVTYVIYLKPENEEILKIRLQKRGFSQQEIKKRLDEEQKLWEMYHQRYTYIIVNKEGRLKETVESVAKLIL